MLALYVCTHKNMSLYSYTSKFYTKLELCTVYEGIVFPVGTKDKWAKPSDIEQVDVKPPNQRRAAGRPKTERFKSFSEQSKNQYRCSSCGISGHNKVACKNPIKFEARDSSKKEKKPRSK